MAQCREYGWSCIDAFASCYWSLGGGLSCALSHGFAHEVHTKSEKVYLPPTCFLSRNLLITPLYRYFTFLDQINEKFYQPRGLYCMVLTWNPETSATEVWSQHQRNHSPKPHPSRRHPEGHTQLQSINGGNQRRSFYRNCTTRLPSARQPQRRSQEHEGAIESCSEFHRRVL